MALTQCHPIDTAKVVQPLVFHVSSCSGCRKDYSSLQGRWSQLDSGLNTYGLPTLSLVSFQDRGLLGWLSFSHGAALCWKFVAGCSGSQPVTLIIITFGRHIEAGAFQRLMLPAVVRPAPLGSLCDELVHMYFSAQVDLVLIVPYSGTLLLQ